MAGAGDVDRARALLAEQGVHTVECMFADTWGIPRGKRLPASQFLKSTDTGFAIANVAFTWDMHCFIFPTEFVNDDERLSGHARRAGSLDAANRRLSRGDRVLHLRHDRHRRPTSPSRSTGVTSCAERSSESGGTGTSPSPRPSSSSTCARPDWEPFYRGVHCYSIAKGAEVEPVVGDDPPRARRDRGSRSRRATSSTGPPRSRSISATARRSTSRTRR